MSRCRRHRAMRASARVARLLLPVAARYRPELILVSAGYDAHWEDPLAGLHLWLPATGGWRRTW